MARGAGGLRGSGTRGRRAHGPVPAPTRAPRTLRGRSAAAARFRAAIFPARRPARPRRAPARPRPAPRWAGSGAACPHWAALQGRGYASPRPQVVTAAAAPSRRPARLGWERAPRPRRPRRAGGLWPCPGSSQSRVRAAPRVSPPALSARRKTGRRGPAHGPPGLGGALGRPGGRQPGKGGGPLRPALSGPTREPGLSEAKRLTYVSSKQRAAHPAVKSREQADPLRVPAVPPTFGPRMAHGWAGGTQSLGLGEATRGAGSLGAAADTLGRGALFWMSVAL